MKNFLIMENRKSIYIIFFIISIFIILPSCSDFSDTGGSDKDNIDYPDNGNDGGKEPVPLNINVIGKTSSQETSLDKVKISVAGKLTTSDRFGNYAVENVNTLSTETDIIISAEKKGYAPQYKKTELSSDATIYLDFNLLPFSINEEINDFSIQINDLQNKIIIDLENNSLPESTKLPLKVFGLEGSSDIKAFPGTYKGISIEENYKEKEYFLKRSAFFYLGMTDNEGYPVYNLENDILVKFILPDSFQISGKNSGFYKIGDKIDLWKFEPGLCKWVLSDTQGEVLSHLDKLYVKANINSTGWWSVCDKTEESQKILIKTEDTDKNAIQGIRTYVETTDKRFITQYNSTQPSSLTTESGVAYIDIPKNSKLNIAVLSGKFPNWFPEQVDTTGYPDIFVIGTFTIKRTNSITGFVKRAEDNTLLKDVKIYTNSGDAAISGEDGAYTLNYAEVNENSEIELFITGKYSADISMDILTKDILLDNQSPEILYIHVSPSNKIGRNSLINLKAGAVDAENGTLNYAWSTDNGSFDSSINDSAAWRAPSSGEGEAVITLEVTDDKGAKTSKSTKLYWENRQTSNTLKILVKDYDLDQPVSGIDVIRHIDNSNYTHLKTDENGIADFGNIPDKVAYFTISYEQISSREYDNEGNTSKTNKIFMLETIKKAETGEITYYIKTDSSLSYCNGLTDKSINFNWIDDINKDASVILFSPYKSSYIPLSDYSNPTLFKTCDFLLQKNEPQDENTFSIISQLVLIDLYTAMPYVTGYYTQKDISLDTMTIDADMNKKPLISKWYNSNEIPSVIAATGIRKGVEYQLISNYANPSLSTRGNIYFPNEEFFDSYNVTLYDSDTSNSRVVSKKTDSYKLEPSMSLEFGDILFSDIFYRLKSDKFEWKVKGVTDLDYQTINIFPDTESEYNFQWKIYLDDTINEWTKPGLPEEIKAKMPSDFQNTINFLTGAAFSDYSGFSEIFNDMQKKIVPSENTEILQITTSKPELDKDN